MISCGKPPGDAHRPEARDDHARTPAAVDRAGMPARLDRPVCLLRAGPRREPAGSRLTRLIDDRLLKPLARQPADCPASAAPGRCRRAQAGSPPDGEDGARRNLPAANTGASLGATSGALDQTLPAAEHGHRASGPRPVRRHRPHSNALGCLCLVAVVGWATRKVIAWWLSNTMEPDFCVEVLKEALIRRGE